MIFRIFLITIGVVIPWASLLGQKTGRFQQEVHYTLEVRLDDKDHVLHGREKLRYINHSPGPLQCIYMHLWPNAYRDNETALAQQARRNSRFTGGGNGALFFAPPKKRGRIDSLDFKVKGNKVDWRLDSANKDIAILELDTPLPAGDTLIIKTPFRVDLPSSEFSRLGHKGQSYQISQWYPKPAVFDKNGWHEMPYLNQGEFYSEFGSFDVRITLPENYVVEATGILQNPEEREWLQKKARETRERKSFDSTDMAFPPSSAKTKTLHYKQDRVHDFAWFADKRYHVMTDTAYLPGSREPVTTRVLFTNRNAKRWKEAAKYVSDAVEFYSERIGNYPYDKASAVQGALGAGGGMEYPMVTVIGETNSAFSLDRVIAHEVGHNWFYGILGSNERIHPWMDEGLNSYYETRYIEEKYPTSGILKGRLPETLREPLGLAGPSPWQQHYFLYTVNARRDMDQPPGARATAFTPMNYGGMVYSKSALLFKYLEAYIGKDLFDRSMQTYFEARKFKHARPYDVVKAFADETGKDLSWFWEMFRTDKKLDYKITSVSHQTMRYGEEYRITVKNKGEIIAPIPISVVQEDTVARTFWKPGIRDEKTLDMGYFPGKVEAFMIDGRRITPDVNRNNNRIRAHGFFKGIEPLSLRPFFSIEDPLRTQIHYTPLAAWNHYDGFMAGMAFHNHTLPEPPLDYTLAPLYAFDSETIEGSGNIGWNHHFGTEGIIDHLRLEGKTSRFHYWNKGGIKSRYTRFAPGMEMRFGKSDLKDRTSHKLRYRFIRIDEKTTINRKGERSSFRTTRVYQRLSYQLTNDDPFRPFTVKLKGVYKPDLLGLSVELDQRLQYNTDGKELRLRLFSGKHLVNETSNPRFNWRMDGLDGFHDHTYRYSFLGRSEREGFLAQQFVPKHGAFKVPTAFGQSPDRLTALNFSTDLPGALPMFLFADLGYDHENSQVLYDGGVGVSLVKDIAALYVPLTYSEAIAQEIDINQRDFWDNIRFTLRINELAPFERLRKIGP